MSYTTITEKETGDGNAAREGNIIRSNFIAGIGQVTRQGDLLVGDDEQSCQRLGVGSDGQALVCASERMMGLKWDNSGLVPVGGIVIWSGSEGSIPTGWQICDGTNGTPNLQDRFVVGSGDDYTTDDTGGQTTVNLQHDHDYAAEASEAGSHSHTIDGLTGGAHAHGYSGETSEPDYYDPDGLARHYGTGCAEYNHTHTFGAGNTDTDGAHTHPGSSVSGGAHKHTMVDASTDNQLSSSQDVRPPYYGLCYIQRMV